METAIEKGTTSVGRIEEIGNRKRNQLGDTFLIAFWVCGLPPVFSSAFFAWRFGVEAPREPVAFAFDCQDFDSIGESVGQCAGHSFVSLHFEDRRGRTKIA